MKLFAISINKKILATILFAKLQIAAIIILAFFIFPFNKVYFFANFHYPLKMQLTLQSAFSTWDAQHYLYISQKGYSPNDDSDAFPPLFPAFIYLVNLVVKNSFISALLVSNISSIAAFYLFYLFVKNISNEKVAYRSLVFLLIFPTSFYFLLSYTESVFFLLLMMFFYSIQKRNLFLASTTALFFPLARLIGIATVIPFLFSYILDYSRHSLHTEITIIARSLYSPKTLLLLSPFIGLGLYMWIMFITTGSWFTAFIIQQNFVSQFSFFHIFNPLFFLKALFDFPLQINGFTNSLIDRIFFLAFIAFLPFLFRRVSFTLFIYSLVFALLPVLSGSFMSYTRYLVIIFPVYIALAKMSYEKKYSRLVFPFLYMCIALQTIFLMMHALSYWIS